MKSATKKPKQAKTMREALGQLISAIEEAHDDDVNANMNPLLHAALNKALSEARKHFHCRRYVVRVPGEGYVKNEGGGWAIGVERKRAATYTEKVANAYAYELQGVVEPVLED